MTFKCNVQGHLYYALLCSSSVFSISCRLQKGLPVDMVVRDLVCYSLCYVFIERVDIRWCRQTGQILEL